MKSFHFPAVFLCTCLTKVCEANKTHTQNTVMRTCGKVQWGLLSWLSSVRGGELVFQTEGFFACSFEKRRIIVRQGDPGFCFYFIVSGTVSVTVTSKDYKTGVYVTTTVDVLGKNDAFGVSWQMSHKNNLCVPLLIIRPLHCYIVMYWYVLVMCTVMCTVMCYCLALFYVYLAYVVLSCVTVYV